MNKQFLFDVLKLAEEHCGSDFTRKMLEIRTERERILNNVWKKEPLPEDLSTYQKELILRDIDFDTIVYHSKKCLHKEGFNKFQYDIAEAAINHGEFQRARKLLNAILYSRGKSSQLNRANILEKIGKIELYFNNFRTAHNLFKRSLQMYTQINNQEGIISINNCIGATLIEEGRLYQGEIHFIKARKITDEIKAPNLSAKTNMNLGIVYNMRGLFNDALICYKKVLEIIKSDQSDQSLLSNLYLNIAISHKFLQEYDESSKNLEKALTIAQKNNYRYLKGLIYLAQAELKANLGNYSAATALVTSAFAIFTEIGDNISRGEAYKILGMINREQKNYDISLSYFENSQKVAKNPIDAAEVIVEKVKLYQQMGEVVQAKKALKEAIRYYKKASADARIDLVNQTFSDLV